MNAMLQGLGTAMRRFGAARAALAVVVAWSVLAWPPGPGRADERVAGARDSTRMAQLPRYSASGTHQCGGNRSCIVSGQFNDCNDAMSSLRTRDCCATARGGGASTGFALNYCIPENFRR
jgi:hypothetical protein